MLSDQQARVPHTLLESLSVHQSASKVKKRRKVAFNEVVHNQTFDSGGATGASVELKVAFSQRQAAEVAENKYRQLIKEFAVKCS